MGRGRLLPRTQSMSMLVDVNTTTVMMVVVILNGAKTSRAFLA